MVGTLSFTARSATTVDKTALLQAYVKASLKPDLKDKCLSCLTPGVFTTYFCPVDNNCYDNSTIPNPYNFELPCKDYNLINTTDLCMGMPKYVSNACDDLFYWGSERERLTQYYLDVTLEP